MLSAARNQSIFLLSLCFVALSVSLFNEVLSWVLILVFCALIMRTALFFEWHKTLPKVRTLNLLAMLSGIALAWFSFQLGLLLSMVNLLVMASALKLMMLRSQRDFLQLVATQVFLTACGFIFEQSIGFSLFYVAISVLILLSLAMYFAPGLSWRKLGRHTGIMALQAVPIAVLLFLVLPKLEPLWQLPTSRGTETGLSDTVTPGDIAELSRSAKLAFRATFDGPLPAPQDRYWRAVVMEHFDGKTWQTHPNRTIARRQYRDANSEFNPNTEGRAFAYQVIAEPTHQRYLFALDVAVPSGAKSNRVIWQDHTYQLLNRDPLHSPFLYDVRSYPDTPMNGTLYSLERRINLQQPEQGNPQTRRWVAELRAQNADDAAFILAVQQFFIEQRFIYTLQPDVMHNNPVDLFLFDKQAGFCAHYASAMAYTLRLGGIPARMVAGYQGGEVDNDGYISVYQYDAHAWVEAWLDDRGWLRFDPTALVAPDRLMYGLQNVLSQEDSALLGEPLSLARLSVIPLFNQIRLILADIDYAWSKWFLGFDQQSQQDMLRELLGELSVQRLMYLSLGTLLVITALLAIFFMPRWKRDTRSIEVKAYEKALGLLADYGIQRSAHTAPETFSQQVSNQCSKEVAGTFSRLTSLYVGAQYRRNDDKVFITNTRLKTKSLLTTLKQQLRAQSA